MSDEDTYIMSAVAFMGKYDMYSRQDVGYVGLLYEIEMPK
jgi:hypothetical protein